jgi:cobalt-zinc-cadmium efflux system protein
VGAAFRWAVLLNLGYLLVEAVAGLLVGSLALLADAAHNLTDVAGLLLAWGAAAFATRRPSARFTYGLGRGTILAAFANAVAILVGVGAVIWEAVDRLAAPPPVPGGVVLAVALVGIAVNAGTALLFRERARHDLNARGAFLHMAADAAVSLGVVLAAGLILATGLDLLDPIVAILVSLIVAWTAFDLLRASLGLSFDAIPRGIDPQEVRDFLASRPGVVEVHDLHVWPLSTTTTALTAHLVMPGGHPGDGFLADLAHVLEERFGIAHVTVQIETGDGAACRLAPDEVI